MNSESNRLATFTNWPASAPVDPPRLARGGFYYNGQGTEVQCFSCQAKISQWNYGDQVMWRHRLVEPHCTYVEHPSLSGNICMETGPGTECNYPDTSNWSEAGDEITEADSATQDYGLTEDDEMYKSDALRLLSFIGWEDASVSTAALVQAGFYHAGAGRLRCAWCGGELAPYNNLGSLGTPLEIHRIYFPRCDHAATVMAALNWDPSVPTSPSDTPPLRSPVPNDNEPQTSGAAHNSRILREGNTWRALGVVSGGARHPNYSSLQTRIASFEHWPPSRTQTPLSLAEAGFFHAGSDDQVRCFYCDGGLGKWEAGDTPWEEHAKWFPLCGYVLLVKGQEYVDTHRQRPSHRRKKEANPNNTNEAPANMRQRVIGDSSPVMDQADFENTLSMVMESPIGLAALAAGLDGARVKRAIAKRLRNTGTVFTSSEALIDAALDEQLNEEAWSIHTNQVDNQRAVRDLLHQALGEFIPLPTLSGPGNIRPTTNEQTNSSQSEYRTRTPSPNPAAGEPAGLPRQSRSTNQNKSGRERSLSQNRSPQNRSSTRQSPHTTQNTPRHSNGESESSLEKEMTLEEENRQLKESRMCKVCMDSEVSVVFLPCGHLVSCARCGAALAACPLCRGPVKALVRAYLA